jgi:hypothetical protein
MYLRTILIAASLATAGAPAYADRCTDTAPAYAVIFTLIQERLGISDASAADIVAQEMTRSAIFPEVVRHDPMLAAALKTYRERREVCGGAR